MTIFTDELEYLEPEQFESLDSWISRVAAASFIDRRMEITASAGIQYANRQTLATVAPDGLPKLAALIGANVNDLQDRSYLPSAEPFRRQFFGTTVHHNDLAAKTRRYSPSGLRKKPYARAIWQLRVPFCVETWEILTDRCPRPSCGAVQGWRHSIGLGLCDICAKDLTSADATSIPPELRQNLEFAVGLTNPDEEIRQRSLAKVSPAIAALGADGAYEILLRLVPVVDPTLPHSNTTRFWKGDPLQIADAMHKAWPLICGWPNSFLTLVSDHFVTPTDRFGDGNHGATRIFLRLADSPHVPDRVAALIKGLRSSITIDAVGNAVFTASSLDIKQAAKLTGISAAPLAAIRRSGALVTIVGIKADRLIALFDKGQILTLKEGMRDRLGLDEVATKSRRSWAFQSTA